MTDVEIAVSIAEHEKEIGSLKHRVADLEEIVDAINELAVSVRELAITVTNNNERMEGYERRFERQGERIGELEKKPAKRWDSLTNVVITALVSGVIGFVLSNIL